MCKQIKHLKGTGCEWQCSVSRMEYSVSQQFACSQTRARLQHLGRRAFLHAGLESQVKSTSGAEDAASLTSAVTESRS